MTKCKNKFAVRPPRKTEVVSDCKFLTPCRARMRREICSALPFVGAAGSRRLNELRSSGDGWLRCVYVCPDAMEANTEMEGLAAWFVDKAIKNCLKMMWRIRESVVGRLNVAAGQLIVSPGW